MFNFYSPADVILPARRRFLQQAGLGFGSVALASMLQAETASAANATDPLALRPPHFAGIS